MESPKQTMILVAHSGGKSWIIDNVDWSDDWNARASLHMKDPKNKFMFGRARVLELAHNIHNRKRTACGVWEVFHTKREKSKEEDAKAYEETTDITDNTDNTDSTEDADETAKESEE